MAVEAQQVPEQSPQAQFADVAPVSLVAASSASAFVSRVLSLQATAGNRATIEAITRLRTGERSIARAPGKQPKGEPVVISADSFDGAASAFHRILAANQKREPARLIVANGARIHVYDEKGDPVGPKKGFRLTREVGLTAGVFVESRDRRLHVMIQQPDGQVVFGGALKADVDFAKDVDDREGFAKTVGAADMRYYVFPTARLPTEVKPPDPQDLPEFMQFEAKNAANLKAWDATVSPLTPQIATVGSKGSYRCDVNKNVGQGLLDRTTNLMEPTSFRWEVLKLDQSLKVTDKSHATRWKGLKANFAQREKHLQEDRDTWLGDHRDRQGSLEKAARRVAADQITDARLVLAMSGEVAMTFVHALVGDTKTPNVVDYIDVPWTEPGDFFVRCLATPMNQENQKNKRATSVAGLMVSVFDPTELAGSSLPSPADEKADAEENVKQLEAKRSGLDDPAITKDMSAAEIEARRELLAIDIAFEQAKGKAAGNTEQTKAAELAHVQAQIDYMTGASFPKDAKLKAQAAKLLPGLKEKAAELKTTLEKAKTRFGSDMTPAGMMAAVLIDEDTAERKDLTFALAERTYVNADELEVQIVDVTQATGRRFNGRGAGRTTGRAEAWEAALLDLRSNLGRGRGFLAYRPPALYQGLKADVPNPMQLRVAALDQLHETVDDAANAASLVAVVAAPFTGGASLGAFAIIGPIQAASSAYRILDRALYDDLQWDEGAVMDLVNIATLGLGKVGQIKAAGRGLQIVASGSNIAVKVFDKGQLLWMTMQTFQALTESVPGEDERTGRRRRLLKLLEFAQAASIPVAESLWPAGTHGKPAAPDPDPHAPAGPHDPAAKPGKPTDPHTGPHDPAAKPGKPTDPHTGPHDPAAKPGKPTDPHTGPQRAEEGGGAGRTPAPARLAREVPKSLGVDVHIDPKLKGTATVRVEYEQNPLTREITEVRMVCGDHASPADIRAHVATARAMLRYKGLSGKVRLLLHDLGKLVGSKAPPPGSRAWEAQLELNKLPAIILEKARQLQDAPPERRDQLIADLNALESQVAEHAKAVELLGSEPGKGYVAAETPVRGPAEAKSRGFPDAEPGYYWRFRYNKLEYVAKGANPPRQYNEQTKQFEPAKKAPPDVPFAPETTKGQAYDALGGYDRATDFGEYCHVLVDVMGIATHQELIDLMQAPANRMPRTVRGNLKDLFGGRIQAYLRDPVRLRESEVYKTVLAATNSPDRALKAASHGEMVRITRQLESQDRGPVAERWYLETHAPDATPQVGVTKDKFPQLTETRRIDMMEGNKVREIKNVSGALDAKNRTQIQDFIALIGAEVPLRSGETRKVESLEVSFVDPLGVRANERYMRTTLTDNPGLKIAFEIFNSRGDSRVITKDNIHRLDQPGLSHWLGLPTKAAAP
jgi:hypothetical protein